MISIPYADGIVTDNDYYFLDSNRAALMAADGDAQMSIRKGPNDVMIHIQPSNQNYRQEIINNLLAVNRLLGIKIVFSKSLKISKTISFSVPL